jgi:hypothetical protein
MLTAERLRELLDYDAESGVFTWRVSPALGVPKGATAGSTHHTGYIFIRFKKRNYAAHRLAWFYVHGEWPPAGIDIDHANGDRSDNRIANLRLATRSQNCANRRRQINNTSGVTGVRKLRGKWMARIKIGGEYQYLGVFAQFQDAVTARNEAAAKHFGEFARN